MQTLEKYIARKSLDSNFLGLLNGECTVCRKTVELFGKIHTEGLAKEKLAEKAEVKLQEMTELEEMDHCSYELMEKLCRIVGLEPPVDCKRR